MSRGPQPLKAKEAALPVAGRRGLAQRYQHRRGNICDFSIMSPGLVSFVCTVRLILLSSKPEDILHDYAKVIGQLRFIASSPAISRELWLHTPHGAWRFFRVLDDSIIELDCYGMPLANGTGPSKDVSPVAGSVAKPEPALPAGKNPEPADNRVPEKNGGSRTAPAPSPTQENNLVPAIETEDEPPPGINLELIRRFMRWRKERQKKGPGSG